MTSQSHMVNARTNSSWYHTNNGKVIQGRQDWYSVIPMTLIISDMADLQDVSSSANEPVPIPAWTVAPTPAPTGSPTVLSTPAPTLLPMPASASPVTPQILPPETPAPTPSPLSDLTPAPATSVPTYAATLQPVPESTPFPTPILTPDPTPAPNMNPTHVPDTKPGYNPTAPQKCRQHQAIQDYLGKPRSTKTMNQIMNRVQRWRRKRNRGRLFIVCYIQLRQWEHSCLSLCVNCEDQTW